MISVPLIALPTTSAKRAQIAGLTLYHLTPRANLEKILQGKVEPTTSVGENYNVRLLAKTGWSITPLRLFRDYSVLDTDLFNVTSGGDFLYFFVGKPNWWALLKNVQKLNWDKAENEFGVIRVHGSQLVAQDRPLFFRGDDSVIVTRGEYNGPAHVNV